MSTPEQDAWVLEAFGLDASNYGLPDDSKDGPPAEPSGAVAGVSVAPGPVADAPVPPAVPVTPATPSAVPPPTPVATAPGNPPAPPVERPNLFTQGKEWAATPATPPASVPASAAPGSPPAEKPNLFTQGKDWAAQKAHEAGKAIGEFDEAHGRISTRAGGVMQAIGGATEAVGGGAAVVAGAGATATGAGAVVGVPGIVAGSVVAVNGADNLQAGLRTAWTGEAAHTLASQAVGSGLRAAGVSEQTAGRVAGAVELGQGFVAGPGNLIAKGAKEATALSTAGRAERELSQVAPHVPPELPGPATARHGPAVEVPHAVPAHAVPPEPHPITPESARPPAADGQSARETAAPKPAETRAPVLEEIPPVPAGRQIEVGKELAKTKPGSADCTRLSQEFAKEATHVTEPADRVVLGKWEPRGKGGYNDVARKQGGVWYETADAAYNAMGKNADIAWETNKAFLQQQIEKRIPKFEFVGLDVMQR